VMSDQKEIVASKKPIDNDFQQQRLRAWQPLLTPPYVIATFAIVGVLFLIIGGVCYSASAGVVQHTFPSYQNSPPIGLVTMTWTADSNMAAPIYFYYQLSNFYQNHRRYVKSRSDAQLRGDSNPDTSTCDPLTTYNSKTLYPCGLIAASQFNDSFQLLQNGNNVVWSRTGIAWSSDISEKFHTRPINNATETNVYKGVKLSPPSDEDLIVWMRTAGLPTFKKLYAIINNDIKKGDMLTVYVNNTFPVTGFNGEKSVVISTTSWLGGQNYFLGAAYLAVGSLCLVLAIVFLVKHKVSPRPLGDMRYFNWGSGPRATPPAAS